MKERPILFSGPMVRALLAGAKTQTRRVFKMPRGHQWDELAGGEAKGNVERNKWYPGPWHVSEFRCPYGQPGDMLWVRETTRSYYLPNFLTGEPTNALCGQYVADDEPVLNEHGFDLAWWYSRKSCPAIHMPRWASRINLEITGERVQRLQDISRGDAMAEGCPFPNMAQGDDPRKWYADLWEQINGPGSWDANPWVWVVEFRRMP